MAIYYSNSLILKLKFLTGLIQNLNRVNQNHSYTNTQFVSKKTQMIRNIIQFKQYNRNELKKISSIMSQEFFLFTLYNLLLLKNSKWDNAGYQNSKNYHYTLRSPVSELVSRYEINPRLFSEETSMILLIKIPLLTRVI
jgi:hypothetical protein